METWSRSSEEDTSSLFKSYYVVWKRKLHIFYMVQLSLFKSYYVVWKRADQKKQHNKYNKFKSYYVVWKPQHDQRV